MSKSSQALSAWNKLSTLPFGKCIFSRLIAFRAPFFSSINAQFVELRPGYGEVHLRKRRKVLNHLGTVHAIAMCNLAELVGGSVTDASIPATHRWIPKGMTVEYLAKAETDLRAVVELDAEMNVRDSMELPVVVNVFDKSDQLVFRATINMWLSAKSSNRASA